MINTITTYNQIFEDAQAFSNLNMVMSKTRLVFNFVLDDDTLANMKQLGYTDSNIVMDQQNVSVIGHLFCVNNLKKVASNNLTQNVDYQRIH